MKNFFVVGTFLSLFNGTSAQIVNSSVLQFNNVSAYLNDEGGFFNNVPAANAGYEVPKGSNLNTIYSSSYWISGTDPSGNLRLSGVRYSMGGSESAFHSGPIAESIAYGSVAYSNQYQNALWKVSAAEIDFHIANYQSAGYVPPTSITSWPGNGDVTLGVASQLAPYIDLNSNGVYEPYLGDYPDIRGDQAVYIIMNDESYNPDGNQLGIELHAMFYQFISGNYLNNSTFLNMRVLNRSNLPYTDYRQSLYIDFDIGNYWDDYLGCSPQQNLLYGYNGDDIDEANAGQLGYGANPPCQGVMSLSHDLENVGVMYNGQDNGNSDTLMWLLMHGQWADSTVWMNPLTNSQTSFMFPDNPNDPAGWTEATNGNPASDRRGFLTISEPVLPAGGSICSDFAFIYDRSGTRLENVQNVINIAGSLQTAYASSQGFPCQSQNFNALNALEFNEIFQIYPNPNEGTFKLSTDDFEGANLFITDALGKKVLQQPVLAKETTLVLDQGKGVYFIFLQSRRGTSKQKLIIH